MTLPSAPDPSGWFSGLFVTGAAIKANLTDYINSVIAGYNAAVADPGWTPLTLLSGYTGSASYKIIGSRCRLGGTINRTAGAFSATATTVATLPSAGVPFRQEQRFLAGAVSVSTVGAVEMLIAAGSVNLQLMQGPGTVSTVWLNGIDLDIS